ncbi:NADP-dependent oxidoreductase domain-containing protein [Paraphoma chrysanthemicola]|uniref:NADP-dependent oxidoreductase domain-containing protein n=1 Tax=Paraphoma chrysanthemicola TaxID=798071 RepID=A0A8K0W5E1_9PLEO|nr:NADP-dependent oxidoreductase domain-containing protein [Paraphoma chrysanthemicola]
MAHNGTTFKLNSGARIPAIGFGTFQDAEVQEQAIITALKAGYRHIDTARVYGTEPSVGAAIKKSDIPRSEIFITTKLWNTAHHPDDVEAAIDASLADLGTDYIDLYLMHWPAAFARGDELFPADSAGNRLMGDTDYVATYQAMEKLVASGKARAIGISNFSQAELERLLKETSIVPAVHQLELHPYLQQPAFMALHKRLRIHVTQYSPFANQNDFYATGTQAKMIDDPVLVEIGKKYGKSGAQVALAWGIARGNSVIPKSKTESRIKANLEGDFVLDEADVERIGGLDRKARYSDLSAVFGYEFFRDLDGKKRD